MAEKRLKNPRVGWEKQGLWQWHKAGYAGEGTGKEKSPLVAWRGQPVILKSFLKPKLVLARLGRWRCLVTGNPLYAGTEKRGKGRTGEKRRFSGVDALSRQVFSRNETRQVRKEATVVSTGNAAGETENSREGGKTFFRGFVRPPPCHLYIRNLAKNRKE